MSVQVKMKEIPKTEFQIPTGVKVKMKVIPKDEVKIPKGLMLQLQAHKGLVVVDMKPVKLKHLMTHIVYGTDENGRRYIKTNDARSTWLKEKVIKKFKDFIIEKRYLIDAYTPPVVVQIGKELFRLVSGEHRLTAHHRAGEEEMFVAICRFEDTDGMPAEYWESTYQSRENSPEERIDANTRTDKDVIWITQSQIRKGFFGPTQRGKIEQSLIDQDVRGKEKIRILANTIQKSYKESSMGIPTSFTQAEAKTHIQKSINENDDFGGKVPKIIVRNDTPHLDEDYMSRTMRQIIEQMDGDWNLPELIEVVLHFATMDGIDTRAARKSASNYFMKTIKDSYKWVHLHKTGQIQKILVHILSQFDEEFGTDKKPVCYAEQSIKMNYPPIK